MATRERFYSIEESKPLPDDLYVYKQKIDRLQRSGLRFLPWLRNLYIRYLSANEIQCYLATAKSWGYSGADEFFSTLEDKLQEAAEVWMCVGEMGFRMMDRDEVINGINYAVQKNNARVKIVRGPRVDKRSKRLLDMERVGLVEIYTLDNYPSDHFICVIAKNGNLTLFDEGSHPETIRGKNQSGEIVEIYSGKHRPLYVIPKPGRLGKKRMTTAQERVENSLKLSKPKTEEHRGYDLEEVYSDLLFKHLGSNFLIQPLTLIRLTIRNFVVYCFKGINTYWGQTMQNEKNIYYDNRELDELDLALRPNEMAKSLLLETIIANDGMTYAELLDFEKPEEGLVLAGGIFKVLNDFFDSGILDLDSEDEKVIYTGT